MKWFRQKLKELFRIGRGRNLRRLISETLNPVLRGWINYVRLSETKGFAEELDGWVRRRLRVILWRQCKRGRTRYKRLVARGLAEERARALITALDPGGISGASHMNAAFSKKYFDGLGLVNLLETLLRNRTT